MIIELMSEQGFVTVFLCVIVPAICVFLLWNDTQLSDILKWLWQ